MEASRKPRIEDTINSEPVKAMVDEALITEYAQLLDNAHRIAGFNEYSLPALWSRLNQVKDELLARGLITEVQEKV